MKKISVKDLNVYYEDAHVLKGASLDIEEHEIFAVFGPSQSGKSTFLKSLNRLIDLVPGARVTGKILIDDRDIMGTDTSLMELRRKVGMVFDLPTALPKSIYENVIYGPKLKGIRGKERLDHLVEEALKAAILWDEVKDRLKDSALRLSGGQQQRLCIARTLALEPEVIMLDEPCSGLDPISTSKIEDSLVILKQRCTIILVPHNIQQGARISDRAAFFLTGEVHEIALSSEMFTRPRKKKTDDYIRGRFG
jgi:phosphate transport system ATP-binding protein